MCEIGSAVALRMMNLAPGLCLLSLDHMHSKEYVEGERCAYCGVAHADLILDLEGDSQS